MQNKIMEIVYLETWDGYVRIKIKRANGEPNVYRYTPEQSMYKMAIIRAMDNALDRGEFRYRKLLERGCWKAVRA